MISYMFFGGENATIVVLSIPKARLSRKSVVIVGNARKRLGHTILPRHWKDLRQMQLS